MKVSTIAILALLLLVYESVFSQEIEITSNFNGKNMREALKIIESQSPYRFFFNEDFIDMDQVVKLKVKDETVESVLNLLFKSTNIHYEFHENGLIVLSTSASKINQPKSIQGTVVDRKGNPLPGIIVYVKDGKTGAITGMDGRYKLDLQEKASTLVFSFVGMETQEIAIEDRKVIEVTMNASEIGIGEVVVVGYGGQKKESLTGAISSVNADEFDQVHAATISSMLAGKIAGVTYRMASGRPGASANIQIRNMGVPLFVIDGIPKDIGHFNNISPNDIKSISVLKDASAAIYGVRAANGVVLVTTKKGKKETKNSINVDAYMGWQNWSRFPETVNSYEWMLGKAYADMNLNGSTNITKPELEKWKRGSEPGYQSFDWYDFIISRNAPQSSININTSGGSDKINYYLSVTQFNQDAVFGDEFTFQRTNVHTNMDAQITNRLKVSLSANGRIEKRENPGVSGTDDYWPPRFALFRNRPTERPYANDNPNYINNMGHMDTNWGLMNKELSGYRKDDWRVLQLDFSGEYDLPIKGLSVKGIISYYIADRVLDGQEYTYDAYTYFPETDKYEVTFSNQNPWRERATHKVLENVSLVQFNYNRIFKKHNIKATFVNERIERRDLDVWVHTVPQTNSLYLIQFDDMDTYNDTDWIQARIGYIGRFTYNFDNKYYVEFAGRKDGSWKFSSQHRWGFFPSTSLGWRITEEKFVKSLLGNSNFELKLRGSYGELGDDNIGINDFEYQTGYNYAISTVIVDGEVIKGIRDRGVPNNAISWSTSRISDIGADYSFLKGKLNGTVDFFYRKREGLLGRKYEQFIPSELGYNLPDENVNSDAIIGAETSINLGGKIGELKYSVGSNISIARNKFLESYNPTWGNSWDNYRYSTENRWTGTFWGYEVTGQFESFDQINSHQVNIDGEGNRTLLPGDLIYKDVNEDGLINVYDERPIGYARDRNPIINLGVNLSAQYKGFDLKADLSGASLYSFNQNYEMRWPYQNTGNLLEQFYRDRWHREDPLDLNSEWIPGQYPTLRFNTGWHSNYNKNSTFWLTNVKYIRLRTLEVGYSLPKSVLSKLRVEKLRIYVNTFNLFSIDNLKHLGVEPEVMDENGLQYPQNVLMNIGFNLSF